MDLTCPRCRTRYRLDDAASPQRRLRLRCAACGTAFAADLRPEAPRENGAAEASGAQRWALRLARTLVSDILVYHRVRRDRALVEGRLLEEFADELSEARDAFREETGGERFDHLFRHTVNGVLADGRPLL